ncbi:MAG: ABC transporter ATP-binding protein [Anaerolineales bacterium]
MSRILKYLKPFTLLLVVAIALLFAQANADLALPDYMSRIVNIGIQQNGVESPLPNAMRQTTVDRLGIFLSAADQAELLAHYQLVDSASAGYAEALKQYPALAEAPIYTLQAVDAATRTRLEGLLAKPLLVVYGLEQAAQNPDQAASMFGSMGGGFDLSKLPPGMDLFTMLAKMPETQRSAIIDSVNQRFEALGGEKAIRQGATRAVLAEYQALGVDVQRLQNNYLFSVGGHMLLIALISAVATILVGLLGSRIAAGLARDLRSFLFEKVMRFSGAEFEHFSTASLITRATNDINQVQAVMGILVRMVFYAPIIGIGGIIRAVDKSPSMWWTIALAVGVLLGMIITVFSIALPKFRVIQSLVDKLNLVAREGLTGMMVVRSFDREKHEEARFDRANRELTDNNLFVNRLFVIMMPFMMLILNGATMLILWVGANQVAQAQMEIGDMMAFMQYAMQIVFAFLMLSMLFIMFPRADVSAHRIADVLEMPISVTDAAEPKKLPADFHPAIEFREVFFRYPGADDDVLRNLSFKIQAGQTVGIMGTTGSGKSTVVNLIPRFFDVTGGAVLLDGVDIRQIPMRELRDKIGYIPQRSNLFTGTIESNLRYADEAADEATLAQALNIAQAQDFVQERAEGLQAEVSQGGVNFSGGQKQRLSIARALVKRAPLYIFDDSFSALDYRTDARLRQALLKQLRQSTVLIVSQRVATIKNADQILVLDEGRLIGQGTHEELMQSNEIYREIALSQMKQQEALA